MDRLEVKVEETNVPHPIVGLRDGGPPPFLTKTYDMVEEPGTDSVVSWSVGRNSFVVWDSLKFASTILPKYFKHDNFSSFIRQLNTYGFRKVDPDRWEFANEGFLGGQKHLLKHIKRKQNVSQKQQQPQKAGVCVEVGKFGFETELEILRRDRKMLMTEIFKLRQQQQKSRAQLMAMEERLQGTETKQKQMMAFMARAFSNPTFMQQLASQREIKQRLGSVGRKRRLPGAPEYIQAEEEEMLVDSELNVLLATVDDNLSASTIEVNEEPVNDAIWEDLLGDEMLVGPESIAAKLDDLDEYMEGLLEQMDCNSP